MSVDAFASDSIFFHIKKSLGSSQSFALYRLPAQEKVTFVCGELELFNQKNIDFSDSESGFVICSFDKSKSYFIKSNSVFKQEDTATFKHSIHSNSAQKDVSFNFSGEQNEIISQEYTDKIRQVLEDLKEQAIQKVVISRKEHLGQMLDDDFCSCFQNLSELYPNAFVSMVFLAPENQVWMGASPEILVSENQDGIFKTVALAGTQSAIKENGETMTENEALWSQKEIEEQALVSRYIIDCLKKIRVREYIETGPRSTRAGNLMHLISTFEIDSKNITFKNLSTVMLDLLHPTSAVCGMPKELALNLIEKYEGYAREFYSGYLGPVNIQEESYLFVNLRTMKIENRDVFLYAGGGLTANSDPEKEWKETVMKMKTVRQIFEKS
jgi:isochorismate synthase